MNYVYGVIKNISDRIPGPDITLFSGSQNVDIQNCSNRIVTIVGAVAAYAFVNRMEGLFIGTLYATSLISLNLAKAYQIKQLDGKTESKKFVDSATSVLISAAFLVASLALPIIGPVGYLFSLGTLAYHSVIFAKSTVILIQKLKSENSGIRLGRAA